MPNVLCKRLTLPDIFARGDGKWTSTKKLLLIMNLIGIILLSTCLAASAGGYAQKVTISVKDAPLEKVFEQIKQQTRLSFLWDEKTLKQSRPVTIEARNASLEQVMDACVKNQPITYTIIQNMVVIKLKDMGPNEQTAAAPPPIDISGRVTDAEDKPLSGVSISVKGSAIGTGTDAAGFFTLKGIDENAVLVFSSVGYETKVVALKKETVINVVLALKVAALNETVIIGYGSTRKRDLTGSVSTLNVEKEFKNIPTPRVDQMLQGRATGVDVKSVDGAPGSGTTIRIRGTRSINATNEPLYVIDGIIGAGDLNNINPADIESIDILKDASAAAIYGSRGSNGVIIVTTKQGKAGKDQVNVSAAYGFQQLPKTLDLMKTRDFAKFEDEARKEFANYPPLYANVDSIVNIVGEDGTNWTKAVTHKAIYSNYNLSYSGGGNGLTYYASGNVLKQDGIIINSGYKRYQAHLNLDKKFSSRVKTGINLNISRDRIDQTPIELGSSLGWRGGILGLPPTMRVYKNDGSFETWNPIAIAGAHIDNPVAQAKLLTLFTTSTNLLGNAYAEVEILKGLTFRSGFGTMMSSYRYNYYSPTYMPSKIALNTQQGSATAKAGSSAYLLSANTLNFDRKIGKQHHFNITAGFTYEKRNSEYLQASAGGLTNDLLQYNYLNVAEQSNRSISSFYDESTVVSFLGRATYDFKNRYYFTATGRYDGASNFAENHKWAFFPSAAFKWRVSEEPFFQQMRILEKDIISDLAFRVSYGVSGNQGIGNYQSLASIASNSNGYLFGNNYSLGYTQGNIANSNLTWETTAQLDVGTELQLFKGRVSIDADYYNMRTHNLLLTVQLPSQTGYGSRLVNLGRTLSQGFEFMIKGDIIRTKSFSWNTTIAISTNKQKVLDLGSLVRVALDNNDYGGITSYLEVGAPIGANYGVEYAGTWKSQAEIDAELAKPADKRTYVSASAYYKPGRPKYFDYVKDGQYTVADQHYLGTQNPTLFGGIGNTFSYKKLSLDFFLQYVSGNTMYNQFEFFLGSGQFIANQYSYMVNRWSPANPTSNVPSVESRDNVPSTRYLHDASLIRLKSARISYDLTGLIAKKYMKGIQVYLAGTNLFLLTKYNGFDPEVNKSGESSTIRAKDDGTYPNSRTYTAGININL